MSLTARFAAARAGPTGAFRYAGLRFRGPEVPVTATTFLHPARPIGRHRAYARGVSEPGEQLSDRALGRALLARQGLVERLEPGVVGAVETIGALQAQSWPALPVALFARVRDFAPEQLHRALAERRLVSGTLLRGTLHLVSAREHPDYAAVVEAATRSGWRRATKRRGPHDAELQAAVAAHARDEPRSPAELAEAAERWVAEHPGAIEEDELARQRELKFRPVLRWCGLVRVPADGRWDARTPAAYQAAPAPPAPDAEAALDAAVLRHLRAFGPAAAEDTGAWLGRSTPDVRASVERRAGDLVTFTDARGTTLYDLPDAPRPGEDGDAPVRFLAPFDSALLAYAAGRRGRLVRDAHRDAIYERRNLQVRATYLVDGRVAGIWSVEARKRQATLTLRPLERLTRAVRGALADEGEALLRAVHPASAAHAVEVAS
jgi:hypothetical protein